MRRVVAVLLALSALLPLARADASSHQTVKREDYVAGAAGDTDGLCRLDPANPSGLNIGTVCFVPARDRVVIAIDDATQMTVNGYYVFLDASGSPVMGPSPFCGRSPILYFPRSARNLTVYIGGPLLGPQNCMLDGTGDGTGIGTNGTVVATFSG